MNIQPGELHSPLVIALLREHLDDMALHSPPDSVHALDLKALRAPDIDFFTAWEDDTLLGCGALKALANAHGEVKAMRTARAHRRKGVAAGMLRYIIAEARNRSYTRLSLETGSADAFAAARGMYEHFGFAYCGPFAGYSEDPYSVFMTLAL